MALINQTTLAEMAAQSRDVISNPSVATFERYEKRGSTATAGVYVLVAAVLAGLLTFLAALLPGVPGNPFILLVGGVVSALLNFVLFTGLVFYLGRSMGSGSGSWDEVAYSFALFVAPLAVVSGVLSLIVGLLGWIPFLGWLVGLGAVIGSLVVLVAQVYFGFLAVQSSMNITDPGRAALVLVLAAIGTALVQFLLLSIGGVLAGMLPLLLLVGLVAFIFWMVRNGGMRRFGR